MALTGLTPKSWDREQKPLETTLKQTEYGLFKDIPILLVIYGEYYFFQDDYMEVSKDGDAPR